MNSIEKTKAVQYLSELSLKFSKTKMTNSDTVVFEGRYKNRVINIVLKPSQYLISVSKLYMFHSTEHTRIREFTTYQEFRYCLEDVLSQI